MKRIVYLLLLFCLVAAKVFAEDDPNQALFDKANEEFRIASEAGEANPQAAKEAYLRAAEIFTQIIRSGVKNADIYYNLGNCYFQAKDYPMAILQYRRALIYDSGDAKINSNLATAHRMLNTENVPESSGGFLSQILSANSSIPLLIKEYFNKISYALFWGGLIGFLLLRKRVAKKKFLIIAIVWWLSLVSVALVSYFATTNSDGVILTGEVVARKGDGDNYSAAFTEPLPAGTEFVLLEKRGEWLKIELSEDKKCWIKSSDAGLVSEEP